MALEGNVDLIINCEELRGGIRPPLPAVHPSSSYRNSLISPRSDSHRPSSTLSGKLQTGPVTEKLKLKFQM